MTKQEVLKVLYEGYKAINAVAGTSLKLVSDRPNNRGRLCVYDPNPGVHLYLEVWFTPDRNQWGLGYYLFSNQFIKIYVDTLEELEIAFYEAIGKQFENKNANEG